MYSDEQWMQQAIELAKHAASLGEVPVGAVLVADGELIAESWNQPISTHDPTGHAEIIALRNAAKIQQNYRLPKTTLYVTLEPCTMCLGAMIHARVERLVFGANEPRAGVVGSKLALHAEDFYNHNLTVQGGVLADECGTLLQQFFREKRSKK